MEPTPHEVREILANSPRIAVLGISDDPTKPAHYVPAYLHQAGYSIVGVNPKLAGQTMFGAPVYADLAALAAAGAGPEMQQTSERSVDLLDVFRRAELLPGHLAEIIALRPAVVWFQQGIRNDAVAAALRGAGITVVQDRCTLADHRRFGLAAPKSAGGNR